MELKRSQEDNEATTRIGCFKAAYGQGRRKEKGSREERTNDLPVLLLGGSIALASIFEPVADLSGGEAGAFGELALLAR